MISFTSLHVQLDTLVFTYPSFTAMSNQVTFITGKNGYGKTTLLKSLAGLLPSQGGIKYEGTITYVAQQPVIFNRSVFDNIIYPLQLRKLDIKDYLETINTYAAMLEIDHLFDQNGMTLSAGEKMKTSLIRALIFKPDIILLDEPTTNLDIDSIHALITLIQSIKDTTFIIVSHNEAFIKALPHQIYKVGENNVSGKKHRRNDPDYS